MNSRLAAGLKVTRDFWDRVWFARFDPYCAGLFRISLGSLLIVYFVANYPNWERFFAADGMLSLDLADPQRTGDDPVSIFHWTEGFLPAGALWWVGFLATILRTQAAREIQLLPVVVNA